MGLRYFGIRVRSLDVSIRFYCDDLGLKVVRRGRGPGRGQWVLLRDPRTRQQLELNWYPLTSPFSEPYVPGEGLDHLGFHVQNPKACFDRLVSRGAKPALQPESRNGVKGVYFVTDPDGNWVEFFGP